MPESMTEGLLTSDGDMSRTISWFKVDLALNFELARLSIIHNPPNLICAKVGHKYFPVKFE